MSCGLSLKGSGFRILKIFKLRNKIIIKDLVKQLSSFRGQEAIFSQSRESKMQLFSCAANQGAKSKLWL